MKRILCGLLAALMLLTAAALAESTLGFTSGSTEEKLEQMVPVLDSLAACLNIGNAELAAQATYDSEDSHLIWKQLWQLSANWLSKDPAYTGVNGLSIPADVMEACAKASFGARVDPLPAIPTSQEDGMVVVYDPATNAYQVSLSEAGTNYLVIESYAQDGERLVANCGLYNEQNQRMGGMTVRLQESPEGSLYPYQVMDAHAENQSDFNGLWATLCDIRYVEPSPTPTVEPTRTPAPTETPDTTTYRTLTTGDRGEDVRNLQKRLNALGYDCGSADGVFGGATKRALTSFQAAAGLKRQDGVATAEVQRKLFSKSAPKYVAEVEEEEEDDTDRVKYIQKRLRELGYTAGPITGVYNDRTKSAVKLFQREAGLKVDGLVGPATLGKLERKNAPEYSAFISLYKGDSGDRVTEMQSQLRDLGYLEGKLTGKYNSDTVDAVAAFKAANGLKGNGKSISADEIELMFDNPISADDDVEEPEIIDEPEDDPDGDDDEEEPVDDPDGDDDDDGDDEGDDEGDDDSGDDDSGDDDSGDDSGDDDSGDDDDGDDESGDDDDESGDSIEFSDDDDDSDDEAVG